MQFMSRHNSYFETEGVAYKVCTLMQVLITSSQHLGYSMPTLTSVGNQLTTPTNMGHFCSNLASGGHWM